MGRKVIPAHIREQQINERPNINFVRWDGEYKNSKSKAVIRCALDGFEWSALVKNIANDRFGCPLCGGNPRWPAERRIEQINALPNIEFLRWEGAYKNSASRAVVKCSIDGYERLASVKNLMSGKGCPRCANKLLSPEDRIAQINELPNITFVRWSSEYKDSYSKAVCRCSIDGFEWSPTVSSLVNVGRGCPRCAKRGYNPAAHGTLYILRSECGTMVKIGISNNYKQRHTQLERATPFSWSCIELIHSDDGAFIAKAEKELHILTEQAQFSEPFDGYTEWRKWDDRLPMWIEEYRARA